MSSLWTPGGEHRVPRPGEGGAAPSPPPAQGMPGGGAPGGGAPGGGAPGTGPPGHSGQPGPEEHAELAARLDDLRRQLLGTPAEVVVANHAYGLFELAAIHLSEQPPRLDQARLAVDAMGALVEGLSGRLGETEPSLRDALTQIRLAFVQIEGGATASAGPD